MALGSPYSAASVGGSMSGNTMQEQLAKLYAMSQALRQQSGFGAQPGQQGMQTPPPMPQQQGGQMPMMGGSQMPQMPQGQHGGGMNNMMQMLPMLMMMMRNKQGLGSGGYPGAGFGLGAAGTMPGGQDY